jgi:pimeloyl-ACP methyl ester carboxylesterase
MPQTPPVISITPAHEDIFDQDTREILQEWEDQLASTGAYISQADFFAPRELLATGTVSVSTTTTSEEEDIPLHPSAPRIVISEPDAIAPPSSLEPAPVLRKAARFDERTSFLDESGRSAPAGPRSPQRRHSIVSTVRDRPLPREIPARPTPRPWIVTDIHPKHGCKMRVRYTVDNASVDVIVVYLFNSASLNPLDRDADLALFSHVDQVEPRKRETSPTRRVQRARTDLGRPSNRDAFNTFAAKPSVTPQIDTQSLQRQHVNWLVDADMLKKQIPGMRLTTVGFDVKSNLNFEVAARQLRDHLQQHRTQQPTAPMIFVGHSLGGLFIIKALSDHESKSPAADAMLSDTAGLFLFSSYGSFTPARVQSLASMYGTKPTEGIFGELSRNSAVDRISKAAKTRLCSQHQPRASSVDEESEKRNRGVSIGFPIFQLFARDEVDQSPLTTLLSTPVRIITLAKDSSSIPKFPSSQDADFAHLAMLMQSALQTHKFLHAAASGRADEIHSLLRRGMYVNLRDRWSQTALQIAVRMNHEDVVIKLLGAKNVSSYPGPICLRLVRHSEDFSVHSALRHL